MFNNISIQLISLIYVLIFSLVYFVKRKYNFLDSKIYKILLLSTFVIIVLDIVCMYTITNGLSQFICIFCLKLYLFSLFTWIVFFIYYILLNWSNKKYTNFNSYFKENILAKILLVISIILFIFLVVMEVNYNNNILYGNAFDLLYNFTFLICLFLLFLLLNNKNKLSNSKGISVILSIVILCFTLFLQIINNNIWIISGGLSLVTLFIYFTIENPDIKYVDELNALKDKAEDANKAKTYFLASMSHEIRTPMNVILGLSESMLNSDVPKNIYDDIKNINKSADILLGIVNNILDITKIEEGKETVNNNPYNIADTLAEIKSVMDVSLSEKPVKFSIETIGNIPRLINGDEVKVYQILMNLLSNACKYTKKGSIKLQIDTIVFGNKATFNFRIIDTGIGIKKDDYDKLFKMFERLDQEQKNIEGTGLGLNITKKLVDLMGGKITFESVYQQGTVFTVVLEQEIINKEKITDINLYKAKKKQIDKYFDGSNYDILLVDDNLLNLKVAEKFLKKYNFNITSVTSGLDCLNYTKNKKYDLIFLDHMMPDMDGIHTLYNLKKRVNGFNTPVVVLTANAIQGAKEMYLNEGFSDYISKPINQVELDRILREQLKIEEK